VPFAVPQVHQRVMRLRLKSKVSSKQSGLYSIALAQQRPGNCFVGYYSYLVQYIRSLMQKWYLSDQLQNIQEASQSVLTSLYPYILVKANAKPAPALVDACLDSQEKSECYRPTSTQPHFICPCLHLLTKREKTSVSKCHRSPQECLCI